MDYTSNNNPTAVLEAIDHLVDQGKLPEFVENATVPTPDELETLSKTAFADTKNRLYPIYNKETIFFSIADYHGSYKCDGDVYTRIKSAAASVGLSDVNDMLEEYFEKIDHSEPEPTFRKYAFHFDDKDYYPINNAEEIERSAVGLMNMRNKLPSVTAHQIAQGIVKAAGEHNVTEFLPEIVVKMGERRAFDMDYLSYQIGLRKNACDNQESVEIYDDILKSASELDNHEELIVTLEEFDRSTLPEYVLNNNLVKSAYEAFHGGHLEENLDAIASEHVYFNEEDVLVPKSAFKKVASTVLDERFAKNVAEQAKEVVKMASEDAFEATALVNGMEKWARKEFLKILVNVN